MQQTNPMAFKEWGVISRALTDGLQSIIIRKGGIHEGRDGFRVAHPEFWLFPTYLHESPDQLVPEAAALLDQTLAERPTDGLHHLPGYAEVCDVYEVTELPKLLQLAGQHLWSADTLDQRFHYRQPGVFVLVTRIYRQPRPPAIPDSPHFAGCRSWVELPEELPTAELVPVLSDAQFAEQRQAVARVLGTASV